MSAGGGDYRRDSLVYYMQCNSCLQQGEGEGGLKSKFTGGKLQGHFFKGERSIGLLMQVSPRLLFSISMSQNTTPMRRLNGK